MELEGAGGVLKGSYIPDCEIGFVIGLDFGINYNILYGYYMKRGADKFTLL